MGSSVPSEEPIDDFGGDDFAEPEANDKPFDDTPFDAGVEANEEDNPEKYIQQLSGKLGQSLRKYTEERGEPDYDLEKFAINSVLSATNTSEMDGKDQSDIINKVKTSSTDDGANDSDSEGFDDSEFEDDGANDGASDEGDLDFSDVDMEESFNPNGNGKTVFQDLTMGVKNGGMEENKYLNLENTEKSSIFVPNKNIKDMLRESLLSESPTVVPETKPTVTPTTRPTRRSKPWRIIPETSPNPTPKAVNITHIDNAGLTDEQVEITFDVENVRFVETFTNSGEVVTRPMAYDEPWTYGYDTEVLSNGKRYRTYVDFYGNPNTHLELDGFSDGQPVIDEL